MQNPDEELAQAREVSAKVASKPQWSTPLAMPGRMQLLPKLMLTAMVGIILLTLSLWLGGFHLPFFPTLPDHPSLSISNSGPYAVGTIIKLQGQHFFRYSIIVLLRDGQPAIDSNGLHLAVDSDDRGAFTATLIITPDWSLGGHIISAEDTASQQEAAVVLTIERAAGSS
jgi:hypothetical protein